MKFQIANTAIVITMKAADIKAVPNCGFRPLGTRSMPTMIYQLDTQDWEIAGELPGGNDRPSFVAFRAAIAEFIESGALQVASGGCGTLTITLAEMLDASRSIREA